MGSLIEEEEEEHCFFDAKNNIQLDDSDKSSFDYDVWAGGFGSVKERRSKFMSWINNKKHVVDVVDEDKHCRVIDDNDEEECFLDRSRRGRDTGAVSRSFDSESEYCSGRSSLSRSSSSLDDSNSGENFVCRVRNVDGGMTCDVDQNECRETTSTTESTFTLSASTSSSSSNLKGIEEEEEMGNNNKLAVIMKRVKDTWLSRMRRIRRMRSMGCVVDNNDDANAADDAHLWARIQRVKVKQCAKQSKELSALYKGQNFQAHNGSILCMKFSPDGQYLASAGKDGIVRVWQVVEDERSNEFDIPDLDSSCLYFEVNNNLSELKPLNPRDPLHDDKDKMVKLRSLKKTADSACVVFPSKVFRLLEKPLHEFYGHNGDILDLSWSKNNQHLLSSSADKTVRLWRVRHDHCFRIFPHSNFVTSVQFNPTDENYFVSGSIDGKVRIWSISCCEVVNWTDIRDIVTAVCYRPDGKVVTVGSLTGTCQFYSISDNHFQLDAQICLHSKKKPPCKSITGLEFFPQDSSKVMVTCADSQVRIIDGLNVISKFKGPRNSGNQVSASFTSDGKHIISACEDSNVYIWNNNIDPPHDSSSKEVKNIKSFERFPSDASVAIPWSGIQRVISENNSCRHESSLDSSNSQDPFSLPSWFSLGQGFSVQPLTKGSATWPEEQLPSSPSLSTTTSSMHKSQYKFLKASCQKNPSSPSHVWGLVIVTATWDGRIRSFHNYGLPVPV